VPITEEQKKELRDKVSQFPKAIGPLQELRDATERETKERIPKQPYEAHQDWTRRTSSSMVAEITRILAYPRRWEEVNTTANDLRTLFEKVHQNIDNKQDPNFAPPPRGTTKGLPACRRSLRPNRPAAAKLAAALIRLGARRDTSSIDAPCVVFLREFVEWQREGSESFFGQTFCHVVTHPPKKTPDPVRMLRAAARPGGIPFSGTRPCNGTNILFDHRQLWPWPSSQGGPGGSGHAGAMRTCAPAYQGVTIAGRYDHALRQGP